MITIYSKAKPDADDDAVTIADRALAALGITIRRIEAGGECAALERARLEELQATLSAPNQRAKPAKNRKSRPTTKPIKVVFV